MKRRNFNQLAALSAGSLVVAPHATMIFRQTEPTRIGIVGLDTSHSIAFTKIINATHEDGTSKTGFRVTHAYPHGSKDIESSVSRIPGYIDDIKKMGVEVVDSISELLDQSEAILLETNDGRRHLEQATEIFERGLITFIDKPIAASLSDAISIFAVAEKHEVPIFSASSLRYGPTTQEIASGNKIGKILGADTYSPATIEATHPDLFWYGVHGVESLFTLMGTGCQQVRRTHTEAVDVVTGQWSDKRIGTFRGMRTGKKGYGGTAFGTEGIASAGMYEGYEPLVVEILRFFQSGVPPISNEETIEIFAFMAAAEESKARDGDWVTLQEVISESSD